jgi:hypothetical protein
MRLDKTQSIGALWSSPSTVVSSAAATEVCFAGCLTAGFLGDCSVVVEAAAAAIRVDCKAVQTGLFCV